MGKLSLTELPLDGAYSIKPNKYEDNRGSFSRLFCKEELSGIFTGDIAQINHSVTNKKGSVRGMHFQYPPNSEIKIVKCISGSVFDVIVDVRENSNTFLQWFGMILSKENMSAILIPKGFAHGFQTLEDNSELLYLHSEVYAPGNEGALNVADPSLGIDWPLPFADISERDCGHQMIQTGFKGIKI